MSAIGVGIFISAVVLGTASAVMAIVQYRRPGPTRLPRVYGAVANVFAMACVAASVVISAH